MKKSLNYLELKQEETILLERKKLISDDIENLNNELKNWSMEKGSKILVEMSVRDLNVKLIIIDGSLSNVNFAIKSIIEIKREVEINY